MESSTLRALWRVLLIALWVLVCVSNLVLIKVFGNANHRFSLYRRFHRVLCRILGLKVQVSGEPSTNPATLYASNHISYLDIFVLGSLLPAYFIAKREVSGWPLLGMLAKLQNTLFVERRSIRARGQISEIADKLRAGESLILFPEGTSTSGEQVVPFKSSLFAAVADAEKRSLWLQPTTIAYVEYDQKPMDAAHRDCYAWYAGMPFGSHFWTMAGLRGVTVKVMFHTTKEITASADRKQLAKESFETVRGGLAKLNGI